MNAATQNEMERLVRVNREQQALLDQIYQYVDEQGLAKLGQSRVKALIEAHKRAEAERDALAAHVDRLREALMSIDADLEGRNFLERSSLRDTARSALKVEPEANLARLKSWWQGEALQELYNTWKGEGMMRVGALLDKAIELQEEAEGGEV